MLPSVMDNQQHFLADALKALLDRCDGGSVNIATAYFGISGYRPDGPWYAGKPHGGEASRCSSALDREPMNDQEYVNLPINKPRPLASETT
ncbi:MAG: hypothetical protein ACLQNE_38265 [Thermoguttaceae bacterium]